MEFRSDFVLRLFGITFSRFVELHNSFCRRPGILVLVNDADWELMVRYLYKLHIFFKIFVDFIVIVSILSPSCARVCEPHFRIQMFYFKYSVRTRLKTCSGMEQYKILIQKNRTPQSGENFKNWTREIRGCRYRV